MTDEKFELPEICYDEPEPGHPPNPFPFILVKKGKKMPPVLFIEERRETGEQEPGSDGRPQEIVDVYMQKFCNLEFLKEKLPSHLNDMVRICLGMKPLAEAKAAGQVILDKATKNAEKIKQDILKKVETEKKKTKGK